MVRDGIEHLVIALLVLTVVLLIELAVTRRDDDFIVLKDGMSL